MNRELYLHLTHEFPHEIRTLADRNEIIHRTIEEYAHGGIITREEALCRMIVLLALSHNQVENQLNTLVSRATYPPADVFPVVPKTAQQAVENWEKEVRNNPPKKVV